MKLRRQTNIACSIKVAYVLALVQDLPIKIRSILEIAALIFLIYLCGGDGRENRQEGHRRRVALCRTENLLGIIILSIREEVMLKILQASLQQYVNRELPDVQVRFRKDRGTRDQIANNHWIIEKARKFQKNTCLFFIDHSKAFDCVDHNKMWKILQEMGILGHLTCLLRNLYVGQEATVRTRHRTKD